MRASRFVQRLSRQPLVCGQRLRQLRRGRAHRQHIRGPVAEGNAQPHRQQNGKDEDPEDRLRLAQKQAGSAPSSTDTGCSSPAYSSRRFLPVSDEDILQGCRVGAELAQVQPLPRERGKDARHGHVQLRNREPVQPCVHACRLHAGNRRQRLHLGVPPVSLLDREPSAGCPEPRCASRQTPQCLPRPGSRSVAAECPARSPAHDP